MKNFKIGIYVALLSIFSLSLTAEPVTEFTEAQIVEIERLQEEGNARRVKWDVIYDAVADMILPNIDANLDVESVWMWFGGAAKVNRGEGVFFYANTRN